MKKTLFAVLAFFLAAYSPAPIGDRPAGFKPTPEMTQEQVAEQQRLQRTMGEVGGVEQDTEKISSSPNDSDSNAALNLGLAEQKATEVLQQADKDLHVKKPGPARTAFWGLLFLAAGFGIAMGLRSWAVKNAPTFK